MVVVREEGRRRDGLTGKIGGGVRRVMDVNEGSSTWC